MVLIESKKFPLKNVKVSRVILTSGLLTFMYCIEFCIGIRTVYYTFKVWSDPSKDSRNVSWASCLACLFTAIFSTFAINVLSAIWEQKQLEEMKKQSTIRFTFHIIVGSMIWRYITLWCIDSKECQKKGALLLTMTKFFFTQTFTIPLVIVHVSVLENLDELIFVVCSILCISVNLILTCSMFDWCYNEVEELKKWDFETVNLVPLIFQWDPIVTAEHGSKISNNSISSEVSKQEKKIECKEREFEEKIIKFLVLLQSFGFSFGRLLALGILLKLAGIYAISIMFLQLLISVIYLKFQVPILVSESLPKWRQLSRLAFMSYILIFEWHLNRDPKTAYDFSSNMKHSITYYCVATVESVFYLVTWAVTTNYVAKPELGDQASHQNRSCRIILIIGSLALVFSLTIHIVLLFWRSRRISSFLYSIRRRYDTAKLRLSKYGCGKEKDQKVEKTRKLSPADISDPIPITDTDFETSREGRDLPKQNSYQDLKEPLDDEIEIYFRKCENKSKDDISDKEPNDNKQITMSIDDNEFSDASVVIQTIDHLLHSEMNNFKSVATDNSEKAGTPANTPLADANAPPDARNDRKTAEQSSENALRVKKISDSISKQWGKVSSASQKFADSMKVQIQKRKVQIQNFRGSPNSNKSEAEGPTEYSPPSPVTDDTSDSGIQTPEENVEVSEGFFIGDSRCHHEETMQSVHSIHEKRLRFLDEVLSGNSEREADNDTDMTHKEGDLPCACYICKALGDGRFRRRRSSSVPPEERKTRQEDVSGVKQALSRYMSSPNISQNHCENKRHDFLSRGKNNVPLPAKSKHTVLNLSNLSLENRVEHYV